MIKVILVYAGQEQLDKFGDLSKYPIEFELINSRSSKSNRNAMKIKGYYAARLDPFAVIVDGEKPIKAFYSEAEDVTDSLIKYLDDYENTGNKQK